MKRTPSITVIVVTKNRPDRLIRCLSSVLANTRPPDELVVVNEGTLDKQAHRFIAGHRRIRLVDYPAANLSLGRNEGIRTATGDILCFTDDDCIVSRTWLSAIAASFAARPACDGVFGRVLPYAPTRLPGRTCPCTFTKKTPHVIDRPCFHTDRIGYGNNMAFRSSAFGRLGVFRPWLGIGSVGQSAEDAEFALRVLVTGGTLYYQPKATVFHDRWMTREESDRQSLYYHTGETACYGYYRAQGYGFASTVVAAAISGSMKELRKTIGDAVKRRPGTDPRRDFPVAVHTLWHRLTGLAIGSMHAALSPVGHAA